MEKGLVGATNPFSLFSIRNIHGAIYESEDGHVDASLENQTLAIT